MNLNFSAFESTLCNSYFFISFLITIYYWTKVIFISEKTKIGLFGLCFVNFLLVLQLSSRWIISGHFPLSSLYESLLFLAWGMNSIYILIEYLTKNEFIGVLVSPILLCVLGFTGFSLPPELQEMKPLVPALQSNWLFMHVSVMMLSYAGLLIGSILSIAYLVIYASLNNKKSNGSLHDQQPIEPSCIEENFTVQDAMPTSMIASNPPVLSTSVLTASSLADTNAFFVSKNTTNSFTSGPVSDIFDKKNSFLVNDIDKRSEKLLTLFDNLSYRTIGIGFCFLTLGILSGAVWANETWGTYWSWDPKETWALITWLTFAVYLHTRFLRGWEGVKPAAIATLGFLLVWICYLGVNILGKGLHTYGFLN
jgi:cytochrome c-type biogenesis protein CcsB